MRSKTASKGELPVATEEWALDDFMQRMQRQSTSEEVARLELQLRLTEEQMKQAAQLVDIADPSGEHRARLKLKG
jgi:hypothetical protein